MDFNKSFFNPSAINSVKLYKGGFPARFGGRLSSVIDIRMKEGNMKELKGEFSIGLISSRFSIEGPVKKDKTSFILSGIHYSNIIGGIGIFGSAAGNSVESIIGEYPVEGKTYIKQEDYMSSHYSY